MKDYLTRELKHTNNKGSKRILAGALAAAMVLGTLNMVTFPALTKENKVYCGLEEDEKHTHTLECFSNPEADTETADEWENSIPDYLGDGYADRLISVAESQLSYKESNHNYLVGSDETTTHGWTRYGAWTGDPYADWSAAFAGFAIHYAGLDDVIAYDTESVYDWMSLAEGYDLYRSTDYEPKAGDIVFLADDEDAGEPEDHMGIITGVSEDTIYVIEGNRGDAVKKTSYGKDAYEILGYQERPLDEAELAEA